MIKFSISAIFFWTNFVNVLIVSIYFKQVFWREFELWILVNFLDLISRFGVIGKSEIGRGVCWVSEIITVSSSVTGSQQELVWSILVFLKKLGSSWKLFVFLFSLIFYLSSASSIWFLAVISESNFLSILLIMSYPHPLIWSHFNSFHVTDLLLYPPWKH